MLEEEMKAIKELTEIKELVEEDLGDDKLEVNATLDVIDLKALVTVLNLVEKQQKEIFELNKEMTDFADQWVHKDKIRELIGKFEQFEVLSQAFWNSDENLVLHKVIDKLKEV